MVAKKHGLGAGLGSLIPQTFDSSLLLNEDERIQKLPVADIEPNPDQPRRQFDKAQLEELAASMKTHGVLQPLIVAPRPGGGYLLIAGERRLRAAKLAGIKQLPALVRSAEEQAQLELSIIENVQRVDLAPLEQAVSIEKLHQQFGLSYDQISKRLGKAISTISNTIRLLQLPPAAQKALAAEKITEGHARTILALRDAPAAQKELLEAIIKNGWSVRQAERFALAHKAGAATREARQARVSTETPETKALGQRLGTPVKITRTAKGGRLEISFTSDDELARLITTLGQ